MSSKGSKSGSSTPSSSDLFEHHFKKLVKAPGETGAPEAECCYCGKKYKIGNNLCIGNLRNHLATKHPDK